MTRRRRGEARPPEDWDLLGGLPDADVPASPPALRSGEDRLAPWTAPLPVEGDAPAASDAVGAVPPAAPVDPVDPVDPVEPVVIATAGPAVGPVPRTETVVLARGPAPVPRARRTGLLVAAGLATAVAVVAGALIAGGGDDGTDRLTAPVTSPPTSAAATSSPPPAAAPSTSPSASPAMTPPPPRATRAGTRPTPSPSVARTTAPAAPRPPARSFVPRTVAQVAFPGDLLGAFRDAATSRAVRQAVASDLGGVFDGLQVSVYGRRADTFTVYAGGAVDTRPARGLELFRQAYNAGSPTDLGRGTAVAPGDRGGAARCWLTSLRGVRLGVCGFFDARSAVVLVDAVQTSGIGALASRGRTVREAVVR